MSELNHKVNYRAKFRFALLAGASATAFVGSMCAEGIAHAREDGSQPTVWIELGGQLERLDTGKVPFDPSFFDSAVKDGFASPLEVGKPTIYSKGLEGKLILAPKGTDWTLSGSIQYGRSNSNKLLHQQPAGQITRFDFGGKYFTKTAPARYSETNARSDESHLVADFEAGKDVGLGIFGRGSFSTVNIGVRIAQFSRRWNATFHARPDVHLVPEEILSGKYVPLTFYHRYFASAQRAESFHGIGPTVSWNASIPLVGTAQSAEVSVDWGLNGSLLFGRQKSKSHYLSTGLYQYHTPSSPKYTAVRHAAPKSGGGNRSHSIIVPNVGGFAGFTYSFPNAKISVGYRADFFFGAMDGGLDSRSDKTIGTYGPFATISIGFP